MMITTNEQEKDPLFLFTGKDQLNPYFDLNLIVYKINSVLIL